MTDDEKAAEAVVNGLADRLTFSCDCGAEHHLATTSREPRGGPNHTYLGITYYDCRCGGRHNWGRVACKCGSTWAYGPRAGWRNIQRRHSTWVSREKALRARIAQLEAQIGATQ